MGATREDPREAALSAFKAGRLAEAPALGARALAQTPADAGLLNDLAALLDAAGRGAAARRAMARATRLAPRTAAFWLNLGVLCARTGEEDDQALAAFDQVLRLDPTNAEGHFRRAGLWRRRGQEGAARADLERALALKPGFFEAEQALAEMLVHAGLIDDALALYARVIARAPAKIEAYNNLGNVLLQVPDAAAALTLFDRGARLDPRVAVLRHNRAFAALALGDGARGWPDYTARWEIPKPPTPKRPFFDAVPLWRGEPIAGRTLLVHAEQGVGDTIQFVRLIERVHARGLTRGAKVILEVQSSLVALMRPLITRGAVETILPLGGPLPPFDLHLPILDLPLILDLDPEDLRNDRPFLGPLDPALPRTPGGRRRIGLVWAGNPNNPADWRRSSNLEALRPLIERIDADFFSLQVGPRDADIEALGLSDRIDRRFVTPPDFLATARALASLDLLIAVDTSTAHLAGSMGLPTWVMLPLVPPDWRYGYGRTDTPWYPSMRLFRQKARGDWSGAVAAMIEALEAREPPKTQDTPCKICGAAAPLHGVVDFNRHCREREAEAPVLPVSGEAVYYCRCSDCGFLFTTALDRWSRDDLARRIYNADYARIDPDYAETRPRQTHALLTRLLGPARPRPRILDYGGGSGSLARLLAADGFDAISFDPVLSDGPPPEGPFDVVTCFEVFEHASDPQTLARDLARLAKGGIVIHSTLLQPEVSRPDLMSWWYVAPRNGHVSIYTARALGLLWGQVGWRLASFDRGLHLAFAEVPAFARHLFNAEALTPADARDPALATAS